MKKDIRALNPLDIDTTAGTQPRAGISQNLVAEYTTDMKNGAKFPPVVVFAEKGSERFVLADGFHTRLANIEAFNGTKGLEAEVKEGTIWDAKLYAAGSNSEHGNRRTPKDIRNAIHMILLDAHSEGWADTVIADYAKCHRTTVAKVREQMIIDGELQDTKRRKHKRDGKTVEKDVPDKTSNDKGKDKKPEPPKAPTRSQEDYDREELVGAIKTINGMVCSGSEALEKYKLNDILEEANKAADWLDDLISSAEGEEPSDDEAAFLEVV